MVYAGQISKVKQCVASNKKGRSRIIHTAIILSKLISISLERTKTRSTQRVKEQGLCQ